MSEHTVKMHASPVGVAGRAWVRQSQSRLDHVSSPPTGWPCWTWSGRGSNCLSVQMLILWDQPAAQQGWVRFLA